MNFTLSFVSAIAQIPASQWDEVVASDNPFVKHAYLNALEQSACVCSRTGWQVSHLVMQNGEPGDDAVLVAVMPLYVKHHSFGEYIFDWSWAKAYQEHGVQYYPKLLSAIPFTPVTGPRLAIHRNYQGQAAQIAKHCDQALISLAESINASNVQCLFIEPGDGDKNPPLISPSPWLKRSDVQFHWFNQNYASFDDFLSRLSSRKRKSIKKERLKVVEQDITFEHVAGSEISEHLWQTFLSLYQSTYLKRSGHEGYLNHDFFHRVGKDLASQVFMVVAKHQQQVVAAALFFHDANNLYGRYWGCSAQFELLHFETCYYQGIDYCIAHKLKCFNAGAQGEHKVQRGFEPVLMHARYLIFHDQFNQAIANFLTQESEHHQVYQSQIRKRLPFKQDELGDKAADC